METIKSLHRNLENLALHCRDSIQVTRLLKKGMLLSSAKGDMQIDHRAASDNQENIRANLRQLQKDAEALKAELQSVTDCLSGSHPDALMKSGGGAGVMAAGAMSEAVKTLDLLTDSDDPGRAERGLAMKGFRSEIALEHKSAVDDLLTQADKLSAALDSGSMEQVGSDWEKSIDAAVTVIEKRHGGNGRYTVPTSLFRY